MAPINWFPPEKKPCATDAVVVTRKKAELLCEMIKLKLYGGKNDK